MESLIIYKEVDKITFNSGPERTSSIGTVLHSSNCFTLPYPEYERLTIDIYSYNIICIQLDVKVWFPENNIRQIILRTNRETLTVTMEIGKKREELKFSDNHITVKELFDKVKFSNLIKGYIRSIHNELSDMMKLLDEVYISKFINKEER